MNIKKYFVQEIREGEIFPPFFMPVMRYNYKLATEAWVLPLAPIVWLIRVLQHALWCIWDDWPVFALGLSVGFIVGIITVISFLGMI